MYNDIIIIYIRYIQLIWKLKFHADTATVFSQMNNTLKITMSWFLWMTSCLHEILSQESAYPGV